MHQFCFHQRPMYLIMTGHTYLLMKRLPGLLSKSFELILDADPDAIVTQLQDYIAQVPSIP